jgi:hypothetical protein
LKICSIHQLLHLSFHSPFFSSETCPQILTKDLDSGCHIACYVSDFQSLGGPILVACLLGILNVPVQLGPIIDFTCCFPVTRPDFLPWPIRTFLTTSDGKWTQACLS